MKLAEEDFKNIYSKVPRLCIDLVIKNEEGILLQLRKNEPYKDMWNLPGGTLYKGETVFDATKRIAKSETGLDVELKNTLGYAEYLKEERFGLEVHSVSIILEVDVLGGEFIFDENTIELKYFKDLPENLVKEQKDFLISNLK